MGNFGLCNCQRNLVGDLQAVAFERHNFSRVVGQNANLAQAQVDQNLRADSAFALHQALAVQVLIDLSAIVETNARQGSPLRRRRCGIELESLARVVKIDKYTAIFARNCSERVLDDIAAIATGGSEYVTG